MKRKKTSKTSAGSFAAPEIQQIEQLLQFMTEHNLEEFEYSRGDLRIRLRKPSTGVVLQPSRVRLHARDYCARRIWRKLWLQVQVPVPPAAEGRTPNEDLHLIKSPIVGTFYGSPSPGAEAFVKVGSARGERPDALHRGSHEADERN